ncbi:hypothetical protein M2451_003462 [Dysgonomonas sp. PFB1-18]|uniref:conjugal transfer protein MobB n=1 Tax=unclassified Dysgonomonas TaxID=2630389 RepID=UPI0024747956|nr:MULTISPECIES: conjugal transfer protein MobB [unclassified Dysgonomonas]MDH6310619.1 hypothetical protein [Dysgonomonas sp. PF1-14]MDH6340470.1 hypothetical protein [Dysgonomonas sp. PF1-16]MDH6382122.1 hypothetical protein [Dysgonomonas sp. PFB1-18]MDH6399466.1 hypothetical protein [Dysgonomonas sp. PF1-23]
MVAKISSNTSLFGTLLYNKNKIDKDEAELLSSNNVYERTDGLFAMQTTLKSFEPYLTANRRTENPIFHVSINPSPKDKLSDEDYKDIADRYMLDMGYGNQPYVVFKHTDIDRIHLHVVSIRVDETDKKIDSNFEKVRSMKICRQIEKDYNLHPATKQEKQVYTIPTKPLNYKEGDVKRQVGNIAKVILRNFSFQTIGEYNTLLEKMNVTVEEVKGTQNNIPYQGLVYSALDDNKQKVGTPFKSSLFGKDINLQILNQHFEKSKQQIADNKTREYLKPIITKAMQQAQSIDEFSLLLKEKNIEPIFRRNDQNRIYGVTFIDYQNKAVLNGSRLGKEFSANMFEERFKNPVPQSFNADLQNYDNPNRQNIDISSSFLSLFEQHGTDMEEDVFSKRMKRQEQKRKRGLKR